MRKPWSVQDSRFKIELCYKRNLFFQKIHCDVLQGMSIDGSVTVVAACLMPMEGDQGPSMYTEQSCSEEWNPAQ